MQCPSWAFSIGDRRLVLTRSEAWMTVSPGAVTRSRGPQGQSLRTASRSPSRFETAPIRGWSCPCTHHTWTDQDAEQLLAAIDNALKPHALYRLTLRECEPDHERQLLAFKLEVVCDTRAMTPSSARSVEALMALQRREFRRGSTVRIPVVRKHLLGVTTLPLGTLGPLQSPLSLSEADEQASQPQPRGSNSSGLHFYNEQVPAWRFPNPPG